MTRARIQTRVWLSMGIFVLGFLLTTIVSGLERMRAEQGLAAIADAVLPAAQSGRRIAFEPNQPQGTTFVTSVPIGQPDAVSPDAPRLAESIA